MKCPKCGYEWKEGHLYCDNCGEEIRIVPDFELEIEREMNETLATLFVELSEEEVPELAAKGAKGAETIKTENAKEEEDLRAQKDGKKKRGWLIAIFCFLLFITIAAGAWGNYRYHRIYSAEYQIKEAEEAAALEQYTQAITWLEKAHELEPENADILFRIADYYYIQRKYDMAVSTLTQFIEKSDIYGEAEEERAYDKIIAVYKEMGDYQAVNELLLSCDREDIVTEFQQFIAKPPEFSYEGDRYKEVLPLKLIANTSGTIYYTLDGTTPNERSEVYTAPIFLESGSYIVTAYFVNDYGIESDIVSNTYHIELQVPSAPEVSVYSGNYEEPYMIEATAPEECTIYYTADGSEPTIDSLRYTAAISMPLGQSVYKFIAVSPEGAISDTTVRTYNLILHTEITVDMAVANVIQALMKADVLLDTDGRMRGMSGRNVYKYNAVVRIDGSGDYYVIYEYYEDATGIQSKTERMYGVNIQDGTACRITYDEEGRIVLVDI